MTTSFIAPSLKLFQHMPTLQAIKQGQRPAPVNVEIDLSNRCSRGCYFCHFAYTHTRGPLKGKRDKPHDAILGGDLMEWELAISIFDQIKAYGVKSLTFTGGGEPTIHPRFNEAIAYAAEVGLDLGLYTLGGHIDNERAALLKSRLQWVYVSLDECTKETYQKTKGMDGYQPVIDGIRHLVEAQGKATVGVGFLLHKDNVQDVHDMVRLGRSLGVDYVQFRPVIAFEQDDPGAMVEPDTAWIRRAIGMLNPYKADPFVIADLDRFRMYADWKSHGYSQCHWSALQTVISPNGMVWRCTNKREHPDALLGDLSKESFADIWARSGGPCQVNETCRVLCRGHIANLTLDKVMQEQPHANFI